jgi:hypothetical protein
MACMPNYSSLTSTRFKGPTLHDAKAASQVLCGCSWPSVANKTSPLFSYTAQMPNSGPSLCDNSAPDPSPYTLPSVLCKSDFHHRGRVYWAFSAVQTCTLRFCTKTRKHTSYYLSPRHHWNAPLICSALEMRNYQQRRFTSEQVLCAFYRNHERSSPR